MPSNRWTRLVRFVAREDGHEYYGEPVDSNQDVGAAYAAGETILVKLLEGATSQTPASVLSTLSVASEQTKTVGKLLAPLSRQQVGTIRALGANFAASEQAIAEAREKRPKIPILFYKPLSTLVGPGEAIVVPKAAQRDGDETDYEAELVVVIGKDCKNVERGEALQYVMGYTMSNDVSARKRMFAVPQWGLGKSFDTFLPIGPCIVSAASLTDPDAVHLTTHLNGQEMQNFRTSTALWRVAETISELSAGTTLEAGSIVSMGTGPGEGFKREPPVWIRHGDQVRIHGDHGLGTLVNSVVEEVKMVPKAKL